MGDGIITRRLLMMVEGTLSLSLSLSLFFLPSFFPLSLSLLLLSSLSLSLLSSFYQISSLSPFIILTLKKKLKRDEEAPPLLSFSSFSLSFFLSLILIFFIHSFHSSPFSFLSTLQKIFVYLYSSSLSVSF